MKKAGLKRGGKTEMGEKKKEEKKYGFDWGLEPKAVYKPEDLKGIEYEKDIGHPGEYPFIRGTFPLLYRSRPPLHRIYSGFLSGEDTNARLRYLFERGMNTMSIALDLPTQLGLDSDDDTVSGGEGLQAGRGEGMRRGDREKQSQWTMVFVTCSTDKDPALRGKTGF